MTHNAHNGNGSSSPSRSGSGVRNAPSSTVGLYEAMLESAEKDAALDGGKRVKLFEVATKMKALLEEDDGGHNMPLWHGLVGFLERNPEYATYRPHLSGRPRNAAATTSNGAETDEQDEDSRLGEPMGIWLLPRLLRRLAIADPLPSMTNGKGKAGGKTSGPGSTDATRAALLLKQKIENWLAMAVPLLAQQFFRQEQNGVQLHRELVTELLTVSKGITHLLDSPACDKPFPATVWMFRQGKSRQTDLFTAPDRKGEERPFTLPLRTPEEARILQSSLIRILAQLLASCTTWIQDAIPEVIEVIVASPDEWGLVTDRKGKGRAVDRTPFVTERLNVCRQVLDVQSLPSGSLDRVIDRIFALLEGHIDVSGELDLQDATTSAAAIHQALFACLARLIGKDTPTAAARAVANATIALLAGPGKEAVQALVLKQPVVDLETDTAEVSHIQACCLLLAAAKLGQMSTDGTDIHASGKALSCYACEMMPRRVKEDLRVWTEQQPRLVLIAVKGKQASQLSGEPLDRARHVIGSVLGTGAGNSRKRKHDSIDGMALTECSELVTLLQDSFKLPEPAWREKGWAEAIKRKLETERFTMQQWAAFSRAICLTNATRTSAVQPGQLEPYLCAPCDTSVQYNKSSRTAFGDVFDTLRGYLLGPVGRSLIAKERVAVWSAIATVATHHNRPPMFVSDIAATLLHDLSSRSKVVRLAAGNAGNALIRAHLDLNANPDPNGHVGVYFEKLRTILLRGSLGAKATVIAIIVQLARFTEHALLGKTLGLIVLGLAQSGQLKCLLTTQVSALLDFRGTVAYRLFAPHFETLCPLLAEHTDVSFGLLESFCSLIQTSPKAFLSQETSRIFLVSAVSRRQADILHQLAAYTGLHPAQAIVLHADCILAPLYFASPTKLAECTSFISGVLVASGVKQSIQEIYISNLPRLLLEVLMCIEPSPEGIATLQGIIERICCVTDPKEVWQSQIARSATVLAVAGRAGDLLRGMDGRKTTADRVGILRGLTAFVGQVGAPINSAAPQIMSAIQSSFADPALRYQSLLLWRELLTTLVCEDACPLLAQTTATFVQSWSFLEEKDRVIIKDILKYFIIDNRNRIGPAVQGIANLGSIPDLRELEMALGAMKQQQTLTGRLDGFIRRLDTVNETVLLQSLQELSSFIQQEANGIHKLASGNAFHPCLGTLVHGLLSTAIRSADAKTPARGLALRCLGILGALDPDRLVLPSEATAFQLKHDLKDEEECRAFAWYLVEKVLVKVVRSTNEPTQQNALFLAIKGLAKVCGFDDGLRAAGGFKAGVLPTVRERWKAASKEVQEVVEPLLSAQIDLQIVENEKHQYPLYLHKASYREWLQAWTSDLIGQLVQGHSAMRSPFGPDVLFGPLQATVRRGHDLTVAYFVLPYLVFVTVGEGNTNHAARIRAEVEVVLQDQITPNERIPMSKESRSLCAQAVFELMDHLNIWVTARRLYISKKFRRRERSSEAELALLAIKRVEAMFRGLPQDSVAHAAFNSKSYARALLNYEKILYDIQGGKDASRLQPYYERMHNIYAELNEPDGMEGISTSIISPSIQHQIREHEMTGRWTSAQSCWEVQLQLHPEEPGSHLGLLRCLRNLGHYDSMRTHIIGLQARHEDWHGLLAPYEIESALIAGDLTGLAEATGRPGVECAESAFGRLVLAYKTQEDIEATRSQAAEHLGSIITTASKDSYHRFYQGIVNLHILHELDILLGAEVGTGTSRNQSRTEIASFASRLETTSPDFHTRESILNMRRNAYRIGTGVHEPSIGPLWLSTSKIALKAEHLQTAYSAILQANQLLADFTFVQSAKLYKANGQVYRALLEMEQGLNSLGVFDATKKLDFDPQVTKQVAKATLRSARWMQETGRFDLQDINARYKRAISLDSTWEAAYYRFGQYADDMLTSGLHFKADLVPNTTAWQRQTTLLANMDLAVHNFSKALRFGTKFLYQALPRLITIWLDFADKEEFKRYDPIKGNNVESTSTSKRRASGIVLPPVPQGEPAVKEGRKTFDKISQHIRRAFEKLPAYMWLAVLPQLASRLWHDNAAVCSLLVFIVEKVVQQHPQQAVWSMIGIWHSEVKSRKERCASILARAQTRGVSPSHSATLKHTISALDALVRCFLDISARPTDTYDPFSIKQHFPALRKLVPCDIIIPFQDSMTVTLPTDPAHLLSHKPFLDNLITFSSFDDTIELMASVARPRKLVIWGSDGKRYRFLCKPMDDLRKDNRLMECTSLINRLLKKDVESRKRSLHIRTYAVIPLTEKCGLIEWVPDTAGVRHIWVKCYEPKGISVWNDSLKKVYDSLKTAQKTEPVKCGLAFTNQILPAFPPVFHEWFLDNFPEPTAWLKARTAYGRTAAVMSMVGFVLGLGDRHGENILIDTTNGDVVHVDFNCLFGMGLVWFDIVEKVPFRLTQNMIDGFGITGVEGVFRKCSEISVRVLRESKNSLISVLESFVHDPLLDLQLSRPGRKAVGSSRSETKEQKAAAAQEARKEEARKALATIGSKLKGTQSTLNGPPGETISSVEMTVETLFKEATDPKNLGGMYCGWAAWT